LLVPNDAFRKMSGPMSWLVSIGLGLLGAVVGYLIFTVGLGIGDTDIFDWGGVLSALIGTVIVVLIATWIFRRTSRRASGASHESCRPPRKLTSAARIDAPGRTAHQAVGRAAHRPPGTLRGGDRPRPTSGDPPQPGHPTEAKGGPPLGRGVIRRS